MNISSIFLYVYVSPRRRIP